MYLAGLSEIVLLAAIVYCWQTSSLMLQSVERLIKFGLLALSAAALLGFIRYLEWATVTEWHQNLSFVSRHIGLPLIVLLVARVFVHTPRTKFYWQVLLALFAGNALTSLVKVIPFATDSLIVLTLVFTLCLQRASGRSITPGLFATFCLLMATPLRLVIQSPDIRIAVFHICLAVFLVFWFKQLPNESRNSVPADSTGL